MACASQQYKVGAAGDDVIVGTRMIEMIAYWKDTILFVAFCLLH
jgi:hypothetical protein